MTASKISKSLASRVLAIQSSGNGMVQVAYDTLALVLSFLGALLLRQPFAVWVENFPIAISYVPLIVAIGILFFWFVGFYKTLWRYASVDAVWLITGTTLAVVTISALVINLINTAEFAWSVYIIQWMLLAMTVGGGRLAIRFIRNFRNPVDANVAKRILIYGAGDAGEIISREIIHSRGHGLQLVGFIDDDPMKQKKSIHGVPIFGGLDSVGSVVDEQEIDEIVLSMPSISGIRTREILQTLKSQSTRKIEIRTLPHISEMVSGRVSLKQVRDFDVRDLLRRDPVELDYRRVSRILKGKSILISGAGGSIGSEICRQVAASGPSKMVLFDISEPNLYLITDTLSTEYPDLEIVSVVGDISHRWLVERVFDEHQPKVVFHAAAYKHVPLMEENPLSALVNNVVGTRVLAAVSSEHNVERFVMISTDKAVRPTNMMGATKRLCEMLIQAQPHKHGTNYCAVRFGNVMGSSGSVIPKFERQIASGGPVTVTHPDITRYFMLTSEAVHLVMQAGSLDGLYATYFLDMGEPVRIADLARDMISLHGLTPDKDIEIVYTDLRAGEKLHEELCHNGDGNPTAINKIWIADTPEFHREQFLRELDELLETCYSMDRRQLYLAVARLVVDFTPGIESLDPNAFQIGNYASSRKRIAGR